MIIQAAQEAWSTPPMVCGPCSPQLNPPPAHRRRVAGMVKLVYCVRRREDVAEDEFHRYWLDEHGPLVRSVADAIGGGAPPPRKPPPPPPPAGASARGA